MSSTMKQKSRGIVDVVISMGAVWNMPPTERKCYRVKLVINATPSTDEKFIDKYGETYEDEWDFKDFDEAKAFEKELQLKYGMRGKSDLDNPTSF